MFIEKTGLRCQTRPILYRSLCWKHKIAVPYKPCGRCGIMTKSARGLCTPCANKAWKRLRREREAREAAEEASRQAEELAASFLE